MRGSGSRPSPGAAGILGPPGTASGPDPRCVGKKSLFGKQTGNQTGKVTGTGIWTLPGTHIPQEVRHGAGSRTRPYDSSCLRSAGRSPLGQYQDDYRRRSDGMDDGARVAESHGDVTRCDPACDASLLEHRAYLLRHRNIFRRVADEHMRHVAIPPRTLLEHPMTQDRDPRCRMGRAVRMAVRAPPVLRSPQSVRETRRGSQP